MPTYYGRWTASVNQDFEIEAENEEEFLKLLRHEQDPRNVIELLDFGHEVEEVVADEEE